LPCLLEDKWPKSVQRARQKDVLRIETMRKLCAETE
jgi:hypothetical protein